MQVTFHSSGTGINAQSIGVPAPDCGPKSFPSIGPTGEWECGAAGGTQGSLGMYALLALAGYLGWKWWKGRSRSGGGIAGAAEIGSMIGGLL